MASAGERKSPPQPSVSCTSWKNPERTYGRHYISPPPPRHWLTKTLALAQRRYGKIAVITILAGLAIAVGMSLSDNKAAAQGGHNGYAYTQRVCQEYGQQPRWYNVRDPIPGSDWRSNGGWAIILVSSTATGTFFGPPQLIVSGTPIIESTATVLLSPRRIVSVTGLSGFVTVNGANGPTAAYSNLLVIDRNNDGQIDIAGDRTAGPSNNRFDFRTFGPRVYGATYIRWANMQWCR